MKGSRYNLYFPLENKYVVSNTLKDSMVTMDEDLKDGDYMPICGGGSPVRACMQNNPVDSSSCGSIKELAKSQTLFYMQCVRPDLFGRELHDNH